jgi:hypothetical protein
VEQLVKFISSEWATLRAAPATFALLIVFTGTVAFFVIRWRYAGIVENKNAQIDALRDRLAAKDEQLQGYRQQLRLVPSDQTVYSLQGNQRLKQDALRVVQGIRSLVESARRDDVIPFFNRPGWNATSEEEKRHLWNEDFQRLSQMSNERIARYDREFKVDAIILRDELLARLPARFRQEKRPWLMYEHPVNPIGMTEVADNLEMLAKALPEDVSS